MTVAWQTEFFILTSRYSLTRNGDRVAKDFMIVSPISSTHTKPKYAFHYQNLTAGEKALLSREMY